MSTRRARIKAVTSLPPRRKNAGSADSKSKESVQKSSKSPRRNQVNQDEIKSPRAKNVCQLQSVDNLNSTNTTPLPLSLQKSPPVLSTLQIPTSRKDSTLNPQKTPDIRNNSTTVSKNVNDVFASPARKNTFLSPELPSPKISKTLDLPKKTTPQKIPSAAQKISETNESLIPQKIDDNVKTQRHDMGDDYSIPSVPESLNDEGMDGIVPLQPAASVPKPIDLLKNEIISENAEVLFDPIVPLPSPSKVRPKLRPAPRLGPHRRSSIQGSASESEDETRRSLLASSGRQSHDPHTHQTLPNRDVSRIRNDSVCSSVSQVATQAAPASPVKDKLIHKIRRQEATRRSMAMRKRRENIKRDNLTMFDLIFYNPTNNPIVPDEDDIKVKDANEKDEAERIKKEKEIPIKPESPKPTAAPVPQIKLGPKGEIILDETSLVIKQTDSDRQVSSVVHERAWGPGGDYKRRTFPRAADWSAAETVRFYRALAAVGTDFSLMAHLFPDRTRRELKVKFKKEEKLNGAQVDKALRATIQWDVMGLKKEFNEERALAGKREDLERQKLAKEKKEERERLKAAKDSRLRRSRGSKALATYTRHSLVDEVTTSQDIIDTAKTTRKRHIAQPETSVPAPAPKLPLRMLNSASKPKSTEDVTTPLSKTNTSSLLIKTPESINALPQVPPNIETGSLVVLTVNDPSSPAKKMLQTYIASGPGKLTPVALPPTFLNCVVGYMKKGTPKGTSTVSSPQLLSPSSVASHDSHSSASGVALLQSPIKKQRHSSYTITQL